ncbi:hypothetical protein TeGR_g14316 [Tetraparma gracilis]|uniref:Uncharacterized protein n=1 Tax=Tetraparma gracilis TaxID=2962635 RepID=A0ABQ6N5S0_9STRA|nr:hypothetical protein TeGR_g14316 [Tetraparma gracilis]
MPSQTASSSPPSPEPHTPTAGLFKSLQAEISQDGNALHSNFTILLHADPDDLSPPLARYLGAHHPRSKILAFSASPGSLPPNALSSAVPLTPASLAPVFGDSLPPPAATYQLFPSLANLCPSLLPYECEFHIGQLFLLASSTFLPQSLPDDTYWSYWSSTQQLLENVAKELKPFGVHLDFPPAASSFYSASATPLTRVNAVPSSPPPPPPSFGFHVPTLVNLGASPADRSRIYSAYAKRRSPADDEGGELYFSHDRVSDAAVPVSNLRDMQAEDRLSVHEWFPLLFDALPPSSSMLVAGANLGLLATKLGASSPSSAVVVLRPHAPDYVREHVQMNGILGVSNVFVCTSALPPAARGALSAAGGEAAFTHQIVGADVLAQLLFEAVADDGSMSDCDSRLSSFEVELGRLLRLATKDAYLEVPLRSLSKGLDLLLSGRCAHEVEERYGAELSAEGLGSMLAGALSPFQKQEPVKQGVAVWKGESSVLVRIEMGGGGGGDKDGVSLYSLQWLGVEEQVTKPKLLRAFLDKEEERYMPWRAEIDADMKMEPAEEGEEKKFTFMSIGTNKIGEEAAADFQQATVLSVLRDKDVAAEMTDQIVEGKIWNHAVCTKESVEETSKNLYESPELMRYIYWDGVKVLVDGKHSDFDHFGGVAGSLFTAGLTNFVRLPTPKHVSLAHALFLAHPNPPFKDSLGKAVFAGSAHPTALFENYVDHFLSDATSVSAGNTQIKLQQIKDGGGNGGGDLPLVRVDVVNATRQVHHHYDYKKDGHKRTYLMHIETGGEGEHWHGGMKTKVYLTRDGDDPPHIIPYQTIKSITLIAVLRMGLMDKLKAHAYDEFINMPLFEDMAPWNIVMEGPTYNYIDYDTRDKTYDIYVPHAYQVLTVLMNYRRTVMDFDKCGGKAKTPYGFGFVSDCVGSDYNGACEDPALPVPCATKKGSCQSDFISCLRAIGEEDLGDLEGLADMLGEGGEGGEEGAAEEGGGGLGEHMFGFD